MPPPIEIELSAVAEEDLVEIYSYLASEHPDAALRLHDTIMGALSGLRVSPYSGVPVLKDPGRRRRLTVAIFRGYHIFYTYDESRARIRITRVLHAARDWRSIL